MQESEDRVSVCTLFIIIIVIVVVIVIINHDSQVYLKI